MKFTKLFTRLAAAGAIAGAALTLAGCGKSTADRMYECEAQGVSRDACYQTVHQEDAARKAAINGAAMKQAMENANDLYGAKGTETNKHHGHKHKHHEDDYDDSDY